MGGELTRHPGCGLAHAEGAQILVVFDHVWSEQRRKFAGTGAPEQVHLPEAFRSVDIAQSVHRIVFGFGVDVGHRHVVEDDFNRRGDGIGRQAKAVVGAAGLNEIDDVGEEQDQQQAERFEDIFHGAIVVPEGTFPCGVRGRLYSMDLPEWLTCIWRSFLHVLEAMAVLDGGVYHLVFQSSEGLVTGCPRYPLASAR